MYLFEHFGFETLGPQRLFIDWLCCRHVRRIVAGVCCLQVRFHLGGGLPSVSTGCAGRVGMLERLGFETLGPQPFSSIGSVAAVFAA